MSAAWLDGSLDHMMHRENSQARQGLITSFCSMTTASSPPREIGLTLSMNERTGKSETLPPAAVPTYNSCSIRLVFSPKPSTRLAAADRNPCMRDEFLLSHTYTLLKTVTPRLRPDLSAIHENVRYQAENITYSTWKVDKTKAETGRYA